MSDSAALERAIASVCIIGTLSTAVAASQQRGGATHGQRNEQTTIHCVC